MPYKDKDRKKEWAANNSEKIKAATKRYRDKNKEKLAIQSKSSYQKVRETFYKYELFSKYRLTLDEYNHKLESQKGVCAICGGTNKNGFRLGVDHDHQTNIIRGLLCKKCNTILGLSNDNIEILLNAIAYLEDYR